MDCGAFGNDSPQKQSEKSEDDDYMELFVAKELKDKITPIDDALNQEIGHPETLKSTKSQTLWRALHLKRLNASIKKLSL